MYLYIKYFKLKRLSYSGYGKYTATWKGYDENTIRKTIHVDYSSYHYEKAGLEAAQLFVQWLKETTSTSELWDYTVASITMGKLSADKRVLLVKTDWIKNDKL